LAVVTSVRILPTAIAISAVLHGGAIAWVQSRPTPKPEPKELVTVAIIEVVPPAASSAPPTEVTLLDDNSVVVPAPVASSAGNSRHGKKQSISTSRGATVETAPAPDTQTAPPRTKLMTMRHPKLDQGLSGEFWAKFEANTKPLKPKEIAGEQLSSEIETAQANLDNPRWIANASSDEVLAERGKLVAKRYEKSTAELQPDQGGGTKANHRTFKAKFNPDGTLAALDDKRNFKITSPLSAEFDITDAMMRSKGIDPYSSYKLKVLDETRDERVAIGNRYRKQQLAQSRQHMQRNLDRLWSSTADLAARKQGLFELWDDCAETGSEELIAGGASARAHVVGFIRSKLPAGSSEAFSAAEIVQLNRQRKSRTPFVPYERE
jgi:hypothetical protein